MEAIQNRVTKNIIILFIIIFINGCSKEENADDDYIILDKIITKYIPLNNKSIYLIEKGKYPKNCLNAYFLYKYDKPKYNQIIKRNDSLRKRDSINYYNGKYIHYIYVHQNCVNDSIINRDILKYLIKQNDSIIWNINKIKNKRVIVLKQNDERLRHDKENYIINISKPIYDKDNKIAVVSFGTDRRLTFSNKNNDWKLVSDIKHLP